MKKIFFLIGILFLAETGINAQQKDNDDIVIGKYRIIDSKVLGEQRRILVNLPDDYENTEVNYPVVFHLYGDYTMNYFADAASILYRLKSFRIIPGVILVGVDNTDRYRDLRPVKPDGTPGGADKFARYFREELIPFIKKNYRSADYHILAGPQAGACFGMYSLMEHTDLFNAFILENSFDNPDKIDDYIINKSRTFFKSDKILNKFLYMKIDSKSPNYEFALKQKEIIENGKPKNFRFHFKAFDDNSYLIETGFLAGFREVFSGYKLPDSIAAGGLEKIIKYYDLLSEKIGFKITVTDAILHQAAILIMQRGNNAEAKRIYEYVLSLYPKSLDGLFQMALIYRTEGNYEKAIEYFTEFLKIRPQESIAKNMLDRTKKIKNESAVYEIEQIINSKGMKQGKEMYKNLKTINQNKKYFDENEFIAMGYRFLSKGKADDAIEIFLMTVECFPKSFNAWDSLAEAYMKKGDNTNAVKGYNKSLELNPKNKNAEDMLKKLKAGK